MERARTKLRCEGGRGEGGGDSYPRRSSGFKETINVPRTQWRTNGPLSGPYESQVSLRSLRSEATRTKVHRAEPGPREGESRHVSNAKEPPGYWQRVEGELGTVCWIFTKVTIFFYTLVRCKGLSTWDNERVKGSF
ncbi:hypothetical protein KM043_008587 [Ampulex compressa]|nr:hypothetical protein KM043_008587 [Ampulex compressa]